ncbi:hypothetical protein FJ872_19325 [Mesorhizobium sp. B2-5-9]|uniref:hypothetical protein n=1 Tax=Mesorhizobium sp. B2-5-9 TaxID=2589921 RepID=UPI001127ECED|nr:hypothetical protein [Mesorhizobium sp. B2-5-9]TPK15152.1 hypothetical protein FJ872_19325 [Mesorhizobium sp. B2-5-9]
MARRPVTGLGAGYGSFSRPWNVRRRAAIAILVWGGALITYLALFGKPDSLREAIANSVALLMASTAGSFIFGAVWDDSSSRRAEIDAMAVNAGIPPTTQAGPTVVQQNNQPSGPAMPEPPEEQTR